ncbi:hypothetical protein E2C01_003268 [Portunus trituberculatus]|uniref:Uncharacterized protein n=1 Tax=Portunus trituberculatus TaxID=210409 RepID=A0A5B7CPC5_PORTR|nr:hypothetical protein [Portunus trituberculatus]
MELEQCHNTRSISGICDDILKVPKGTIGDLERSGRPKVGFIGPCDPCLGGVGCGLLQQRHSPHQTFAEEGKVRCRRHG